MFCISQVSRKTVLAGLLGLVLSTSALAAKLPSTGLGQSWPNTTDVSASPRYHVYLFARDGIRYIQVNDSSGNVRAAFATANQVIFVLPIGADAQAAGTSQKSSTQTAAANTSSTEMVYSDNVVQVTATPQPDGTLLVSASLAGCTNPYNCVGGSVLSQ
ncbi:hypothetical protein [Rhodanobacter sp. MP7CTX1]|jgi:hypothetical protein|uniref:hypothetical protein n=1 Tax=Rhodanobacter sp. MP7CTX1 TaxID=2723084 RepID=UPI00161F876A|nr:hypothetical protein [Rhodanobacter sp. MP7CTX1]MBB6186987.1 hypothetical protein [Rhodanobacter sp. MP7CTX1]